MLPAFEAAAAATLPPDLLAKWGGVRRSTATGSMWLVRARLPCAADAAACGGHGEPCALAEALAKELGVQLQQHWGAAQVGVHIAVHRAVMGGLLGAGAASEGSGMRSSEGMNGGRTSREGGWCDVDCVPAVATRGKALEWALANVLGVEAEEVFQPQFNVVD